MAIADILKSGSGALGVDAQKILARNADKIAARVQAAVQTDVDSQVSTDLKTINQNQVGTADAFNITTSNITQTQLTDNLELGTVEAVLPKANEALTKEVHETLINELPASQSANITPERIQAAFSDNVQPALTKTISTSLQSTTQRLFSFTGLPKSVFNFAGLFSQGASLDQIDAKYVDSIANKALSRSANFDTFNEDNTAKITKTSKGFVDPNAQYPTPEYGNRSDTNKLAQGDSVGTVVQEKNKDRMTGAKLPNGDSWQQPESPFKGKYPYNKVHQTESGHIVEFDDTPGAERIHVYHKSGTFMEIDPNGSIITRNQGSDYKIVDKNGYISIRGKANVSIDGTCNISVGGDCHLEVVGSAYINSTNDVEVNASGRLKLAAGEAIDMRAPMIYVEADQEFHLSADVKANIQATLLNIKSDTALNIESLEATNILVGDVMNTQVTGAINIKSDDSYILEAASEGSMKFDGNFAMDYSVGRFAEGASTSAGEADPSEDSTYSEAGLPGERVTVIEQEIEDPQSLTVTDQYTILSETQTDNAIAHRDKLIKAGLATPEQLNQSPITMDSDSGTGGGARGNIVKPKDEIKSVTYLPENFQLSPHFNLGMLSTRAAVSNYKVVAQKGLTYGEIVYNLQAMALNVLEPIYNAYPNMIVTSAFRTENDQNSLSQHGKGQAVDIQFKGMSKKDYYDIAIKLKEFLNYDQMLLEYCNYANNPWIHISLDVNKQRNQIMTFWNHKKHADGLQNLA